MISERGLSLKKLQKTRPYNLPCHVYVLMEHEQKRTTGVLFFLPFFPFWIWSIFVFMLYHDMAVIPYSLRDLFQDIQALA